MTSEKNSSLLIQIAPWNELYDVMREWKGLVKEPPYLDDTNESGIYVEQHLQSMGHDVRRSMERPPFNEEWVPRKPDLFVGIGAGNPLGISHFKGDGRRERLGVETDYPMAWIGCTSLTSYPSYAYYRSFVRGNTGEVIYLQGDITNPPHFHDSAGRQKAMESAVDQVMKWFWETNVPKAAKPILPIKNVSTHDVFICYNSKNSDEVSPIVKELTDAGITCFVDSDSVRPGTEHQKQIGPGLEQSRSVAIFFGDQGVGPWQSQEIQEAVGMAIASGKPIIPVLLRSCSKEPELPFAIKNFSWVDFSKSANAIDDLIWGITGTKKV